ncbi:hypothetical protein JW926_10660 [Candidatus Sumerlaeota bacterium]|nr:hypothetical protein [Candidatus Sumerlaeota bacterium]
MKLYDWHKYLDEQNRSYGKNIFTPPELANIARTTPQSLNVEIGRLIKKGVIVRYARGAYGLKDSVTAEALIPYLDSCAYLTGASALYHYGMILQVPQGYTCFTNRRHNRSRKRKTPVGQFVFVCVKKPVYHPPLKGVIAPPEQAFLDFIYLTRRKGADPETIASFRKLDRINLSKLEKLARRYPKSVSQQAACILQL